VLNTRNHAGSHGKFTFFSCRTFVFRWAIVWCMIHTHLSFRDIGIILDHIDTHLAIYVRVLHGEEVLVKWDEAQIEVTNRHVPVHSFLFQHALAPGNTRKKSVNRCRSLSPSSMLVFGMVIPVSAKIHVFFIPRHLCSGQGKAGEPVCIDEYCQIHMGA
jgi:hypothetical protein